MLDYGLLFLMVALTAASQVLTRKVAMNTSLKDLLNFKENFRQLSTMLLAVALLLLAAFCYLFALRNVDLTVAFAFTSLNYVAVTVAAAFFLNERPSQRGIIAILLIACGVFLVSGG